MNLDQKIRVKVTMFGLKCIYEHKHLLEKAIDDDGILELRMWEVMNLFGKFMEAPTMNSPIEPVIEILDVPECDHKKKDIKVDPGDMVYFHSKPYFVTGIDYEYPHNESIDPLGCETKISPSNKVIVKIHMEKI